ncbi:hypothetical protein NKH98_20220 [Mesorhizobium sp. M0833]|uniref:hypothetical protein n=1 Tax=Mesorhizobium sp. M0833 TaxID=2957009 RepID=UPI0033379AD3
MRMKRSDALPKQQRLESAAFSSSFMLAFALLAKRAMPISLGLRAGKPATMAFRQQPPQDYVAKSMGQEQEPGDEDITVNVGYAAWRSGLRPRPSVATRRSA